MNALTLTLLMLAGSSAFADGKVLVCSNQTSKLTLQSAGNLTYEGEFQYNKGQDGQYGSIMVLGCTTVPFDNDFDLLNCIETSYMIHGPVYQVPKNFMSNPPQAPFSIVELSRDENNGQIDGAETFENCTVQK